MSQYESADNVRPVCATHAPKPGNFTGQDPNHFVGTYVKLGFPVTHPVTHNKGIEHMWVMVLKVQTDNSLLGRLDNDPMMETDVQFGDQITFQVDEIEEVQSDADGTTN